MSKLIIVNKEKRAMMTFEEVYHEHKGMLRSKAARWTPQYEFSELHQTALVGLWRAYQKHDASLGWTFAALANKIINDELVTYHRKHKPKMPIVSLNAPINDESETELLDLVGEAETFSQEIADSLLLEKILRKLPKQARQYISYYLAGYTQKGIAEAANIDHSTVSKKIQAALEKLRVLYIREMAL